MVVEFNNKIMKAIKINNEWQIFQSLPTSWKNKMPYNAIEEGFKDVVNPSVTNLQKLGSMVFDVENDVLTYTVIDKTEEEIYSETLANASTVTAIQFLTQLELEGITEDDILQVISTLEAPNNIIARVSFLRATTFDRDNELMQLVGLAFEKTELELDEIFINANNLPI